MKKRILFWVLLIGLLALDQGVKAWARGAMDVSSGLGGKPWPGVFEFTLVYNKGIAFGQLQGYGTLLAPIAIAIAIGAAWFSWKHPRESIWNHVTAALLASGALGNLYDRLFSKQGVTDMFWIRVIKFPVFNIADACITVAAAMLILHWLKEALVQQRHEPVSVPGDVASASSEGAQSVSGSLGDPNKENTTLVKGDAVRVLNGPFTDLKGTIEEVHGERGRLRILLDVFGRETPAELDYAQVEKI